MRTIFPIDNPDLEALNSCFETKAEVVYLIVQIRKCIEITGKKYPTLKFFMDWCLHSRKDNLDGIRDFFEYLESKFVSTKGPFDGRAITKAVDDFLSFDILKQELDKFFIGIGLLKNFTLNSARWNSFRKVFREIILECPIIKNPSKNDKIEYLKLTRNPRMRLAGFRCIAWEIYIRTSEFPLSGIIFDSMEAEN